VQKKLGEEGEELMETQNSSLNASRVHTNTSVCTTSSTVNVVGENLREGDVS